LDAGAVGRNSCRDGQTITKESTISNNSRHSFDSGAPADRRVRRTQEAICSAFNQLVLTREFDRIRIDDILAMADVARSTFYQHYRSKDDVLCAVMGVHILEPLARAGSRNDPSPELLRVAEHVWENRRLARSIFWGSTRTAIVRNLAVKVEHTLEGVRPASGLPVAYVASTVANWQIASLEEWLMGRHRFDATNWARALCQGTRSLICALTGVQG
jgi:AcrR family transcriptional regulator